MLLFYWASPTLPHTYPSVSMRRTLAILIVLFTAINSFAQLTLSDSLRISLLTVSPGEGAYERFGHTAFRIQDLEDGKDIIFHYGVYNYTEPNFIMHFVQGICNYKLGADYTSNFIASHIMRELQITEQELWLDAAQKRQLVDALLENYRPENRNYRYNFFFDNCATRPFDMISRYCTSGASDAVRFDTTWIEDKTLRDMIQEKTHTGNWLDFGISLAIAGRADQPTTFREQMFLPDYLATALSHASINGHPLVSGTRELTPYGQDVQDAINDDGPWILSPASICLLALLLSVLVSYINRKHRKASVWSQIFDTTWLLVTGLTGIILWFLNFFSEHPAVDNNLNCLLFLPTNILFIAFIWLKNAEKVRRIYFFIIFAAVLLYIIAHAMVGQYINVELITIAAAIAIRCIVR